MIGSHQCYVWSYQGVVAYRNLCIVEKHASCVYKHTVTDGYLAMLPIKRWGNGTFTFYDTPGFHE